MASTSASTFGSSVIVSAPNVTPVPPGTGQQTGFHAGPAAHAQQQQTFNLTPQMEEGIKSAIAATNPDAASRPRKASSWTAAKYFLRYSTLLACVGVILAEVIIAATRRADMDTGIGVIWSLVFTSWHTWRLVHLIKKKGVETITPLSLIIDGLLLVAVAICIGLLIWRLVADGSVGGEWGDGPQQSRGVVLVIVIFCVGVAQSILFRRAWIEHEQDQGAITAGGGGESALPAYPAPPPPPAQIVVHYVQNTCPNCGIQSWPPPGEELNEHIANKGDLQPQAIPLSQLQRLPRVAG